MIVVQRIYTCDICAVQISAQENASLPYGWRDVRLSWMSARAAGDGDTQLHVCSNSCARLALIQTANKVPS
jgi:hypothetical protein